MKTLIYIISDVRSGSTLLENILSNSPEIFSIGELHNLGGYLEKKGPGFKWNYNCSCGKDLYQCEFWSHIIKKVAKLNKGPLKTRFCYRRTKSSFVRYFLTKNKMNYVNNILYDSFDKNVSINVSEIYEEIFNLSGTSFLVDSSKKPWQAFHVYNTVKFPMKIIYLRRDIRDITLSKLKWEKIDPNSIIKKYYFLVSTWIYANICEYTISKFRNKDVIYIDYEYLSKHTECTINSIIKKLRIPSFEVPKYMDCKSKHSLGGTPTRFQKSIIKYDDKWKTIIKKMPLYNYIGNKLQVLCYQIKRK